MPEKHLSLHLLCMRTEHLQQNDDGTPGVSAKEVVHMRHSSVGKRSSVARSSRAEVMRSGDCFSREQIISSFRPLFSLTSLFFLASLS